MKVDVEVPAELVELVAQRSAEIVLEALEARGRVPAAPEFASVEEAAEILRASRQRVYDLVSAGRLTRLKDGSRVLIRRAEIAAYLAGEPTGARVAHHLPTGRGSRIGRGIAA